MQCCVITSCPASSCFAVLAPALFAWSPRCIPHSCAVESLHLQHTGPPGHRFPQVDSNGGGGSTKNTPARACLPPRPFLPAECVVHSEVPLCCCQGVQLLPQQNVSLGVIGIHQPHLHSPQGVWLGQHVMLGSVYRAHWPRLAAVTATKLPPVYAQLKYHNMGQCALIYCRLPPA